MPIFALDENIVFPPPSLADPQGILAVGGDLQVERLLLAYSMGIFPWYNDDEPIIWWSPDPRFVLFPDKLKISKSMRPLLRKEAFELSIDKNFESVVQNCQKTVRPGQSGTWITQEMLQAYVKLHELGYAHSVELYQNNLLVGGLYGVSIGKCFFGESMFSNISNASKYGFILFVKKLQELGFKLIDCQVHTNHLESLGAELISRADFLKILDENNEEETIVGNWQDLFDL